MRCSLLWSEKVVDKERQEQPIFSVAYHPDGSVLVVAASNKVLVYNATDGSLLQSLKGHTAHVYSVSYCHDGRRFASGSQDRSVIIWAVKSSPSSSSSQSAASCQMEGILRYTHKDSLQSVCYNPHSQTLLSCSLSDFGLWSPDQKNVTKYSVSGRITCSCWSADGSLLALGLASGVVSLRSQNGSERARVERPGGSAAPIWCLSFSPSRVESEEDSNGRAGEVLIIGDWSPSLSAYTVNTGDYSISEMRHSRQLAFDPVALAVSVSGQFVVCGGSGPPLSMFSVGEVVPLFEMVQLEEWVWSVTVHPRLNRVVCGCNDGSIICYDISFSTVHALYKDRYAFREGFTDVVVQHIVTRERVRLRCRSLVKNMALYNARLAVQLCDRVVVYELVSSDVNDMRYRFREKLSETFTCSQLIVCANHLVFCQDRKLFSVTLQGERHMEWNMDSTIRYVRAVGGLIGRECLLVGLKDGHIYKVFLDNAFPVTLSRLECGTRSVDLSTFMTRLAVITDSNSLMVFDTDSDKLLFQEPNVTSVAFNTVSEDIICYSVNGTVFVKTATFPPVRHNVEGNIIGFSGKEVYLLKDGSLVSTSVLLSASMYQFIEEKQFQEAYEVACLGVSHSDWKRLAIKALRDLQLVVAERAFMRTHNSPFLRLISILKARRSSGCDNSLMLAEVLAYSGEFRRAADLYSKSGQPGSAIALYTDLCMFDLAQSYSAGDHTSSVEQQKLLVRRAEWARDPSELRAVAQMYMSCGQLEKALALMTQHGWVDMLIETGRGLDKGDTGRIRDVASRLQTLKHHVLAAELYRKLSDIPSVLRCYVESEAWEEAFSLLDQHSEHKELVYVPYGRWLSEQDKFLEAQQAFHRAGRMDLAFVILRQLTDIAVAESRFNDASFYHWVLSVQYLAQTKNTVEGGDHVRRFVEHQRLADIYYCYHTVHRCIEQPFTDMQMESLFNISRYLHHRLLDGKPPAVSMFHVLFTLMKQARSMEAFKTCRLALSKLQHLCFPRRFQESVDLVSLQTRARPYSDRDDLLPLCYRCSSVNPLLNTSGNHCISCHQPFVFSFISFEILALVEFRLERDIGDEEAMRLIELTPGDADVSDVLTVTGSVDEHGASHLSPAKMAEAEQESRGDRLVIEQEPAHTRFSLGEHLSIGGHVPLVLDREALRAMSPSDVLVCRWPPPLRHQFFQNMMPDVPVTHCTSCCRVFLADDFEQQCLQRGHCPFCRHSNHTD